MYIEKLLLKNFGKFNNYELVPGSGLNVIYGENESGKSTLFSFIRGIIFGIEKQRGRVSKSNIYTRLEPWDNPTFFEGRCQLVKGGVHYILERRFYKGDKYFSIVNRDTGERLSEDAIEVFFEGINETRYVNSIGMGQTKPEDDSELIKEIQNCIANLDVSHGAEIDLEAAQKALRDKKKEFSKKIYPEINESMRKTEDALLLNKHEENKILALKEGATNAIDDLDKKREKLKKEQKNKLSIMCIGMISLILVFLVLLLFVENRYAWMIAVITSCIAGGGAVGLLNTWRRYNKKFARIDEVLQDMNAEYVRQELLLEQCREKVINLELEFEKLQEKQKKNEAIWLEMEALQLATDIMDDLGTRLKEEFAGKLNRRISQLVCIFTRGEYDEIKMDKDGSVFAIKESMLIPLEQLSKGTIEQIRLALRLVVADDIFGMETMPIVLDEAFVYCDDGRLRAILENLAKLERQIFIFTCHKREACILKDAGIEFTEIRL